MGTFVLCVSENSIFLIVRILTLVNGRIEFRTASSNASVNRKSSEFESYIFASQCWGWIRMPEILCIAKKLINGACLRTATETNTRDTLVEGMFQTLIPFFTVDQHSSPVKFAVIRDKRPVPVVCVPCFRSFSWYGHSDVKLRRPPQPNGFDISRCSRSILLEESPLLHCCAVLR